MDTTTPEVRQLYNQEAEEGLLAAALIDADLVGLLDVRPEEFYTASGKAIWSSMLDLYRAGSGIDIALLVEELERVGKLDQAGGVNQLYRLFGQQGRGYYAEEYAGIIRHYSRRRRLLSIANRAAQIAYHTENLDQDVSELVRDLSDTAGSTTGGAVHWGTFLDDLLGETMERMEAGGVENWGIPTGFADWDKITGGLQQGELVILSGEPGVGKSLMSMQMADQMGSHTPGVIYSLEMKSKAVLRRLVSGHARVEARKIKTGKLSNTEYEAIQAAIASMRTKPVYMSDKESWTTAALRADLARLKLRHAVKWAVVDYLYLMDDYGADETQKTTNISRGLKQIAHGLDVGILAIHSMNKEGMEGKTGMGTVTKKSLRGSGQVIYDADLIAFITKFRPLGKRDGLISQADQDNMRTVSFEKGRELEIDRPYFHLVKRGTYPAFGDYAHG